MYLVNQKCQFIALFIFIALVSSCSKKNDAPITPVTPVVPVTDTTVVPAVDPAIASTIGFFLNDWQPKTFTAPDFIEAAVVGGAGVTITIDASSVITKIPKTVFGHNAVTWMGTVADQLPFMTHLTNLKPNVLRFPAGSGSDAYFWNAKDGVLPADAPLLLMDKDGVKKNPGYGYGSPNWGLSLDGYYAMLLQTGNQGILTINYGYARYGTSANPVAVAAHLAADWVRYDKGRTQYWEIGNENFGDWEWGYRIDLTQNKDGQPEYLSGQLYAQHFKVFVDSMKKAATEIGKTIYVGAVTSEAAPQSWMTSTTKLWNSGMMSNSANKADFYVVHNYFTASSNVNATDILTSSATLPAAMISYVTQTLQTNNATVKPIVLDEWNMFATGSKQQVSNVSGLFATMVVGEAITNKFGLATRWDLLNGWGGGDDHGLFSSGDEPGIAKWSPRPSFYYLYFLQKTIGDRLVPNTIVGTSTIKAYASTYSTGQAHIALVNTATAVQVVEIKVKNFRLGSRYYWYSLEGGTDNGEFSGKVSVNGNGTTFGAGGPLGYATLKANSAVTTNGIRVSVPGRGAVNLIIENK